MCVDLAVLAHWAFKAVSVLSLEIIQASLDYLGHFLQAHVLGLKETTGWVCGRHRVFSACKEPCVGAVGISTTYPCAFSFTSIKEPGTGTLPLWLLILGPFGGACRLFNTHKIRFWRNVAAICLAAHSGVFKASFDISCFGVCV